jgi:hypothetical protein
MTLWEGDKFMFALVEPFYVAANGSMVGFNLESSAHVESFHHKALSVGATDEENLEFNLVDFQRFT